MSSNNTKYSQEMRDRTARHVIERGKSATSMAEELGIDKNTVCRCRITSYNVCYTKLLRFRRTEKRKGLY